MPEDRETILVVDDEKVILNLVENILVRIGYKVLTTVDGKEALRIFEENKNIINLIILDLNMPGMSGCMVLESIRKIKPETKIVIFSGKTEYEVKEKGFPKIDGFIQKPFTVQQFSQSIRQALDR